MLIPTITIFPGMRKDDLQQLMDRATDYCISRSKCPGTYLIKQFYRNKPSSYFEDIDLNHNGVMEKYIKDNNGDVFNPINGQINGLFFGASLSKKRRPPYFSYFGDKRLFIPAEELIKDDCRLYFSDFYCHNKVHYAAIVVTRGGSEEDLFCKEWLLKLDLQNNPFFTVRGAGSLKTFTLVSVEQFHVEFLYTEDVDIAALKVKYGETRVRFKRCQPCGRGSSKKEGIPKRNGCPVCNLPDSTCVSWNTTYLE